MRKLLLVIIFTISVGYISAQRVGIKTNLLYDATTTMNLGVEIGLANRWTLDVSGNYNPWTLSKEDNRKIKHYLIQPEVRYWLCEKFNGHFFGLHTGFAQYNISAVKIPFVKDSEKYRYEGWATGVGLSYGYSMILGGRWNMEFTAGAGLVYTRYDQFDCVNCGKEIDKNISKTFFAPTELGINLIYMIK